MSADDTDHPDQGPASHPGEPRGASSGASTAAAADAAFEQVLRDLLDRSTRQVAAPTDLAARVRTATPARHRAPRWCRLPQARRLPQPERGRKAWTSWWRRGVLVIAAALAAGLLVLGGLIVDRYVGTGGGLNVVTPAGSGVSPWPTPGTARPRRSRPATAAIPSPPSPRAPSVPATTLPATTPPDQATADAIRAAFAGAFDADADPDNGLVYVQNGAGYHDITVRFLQRYPGVIGNLRTSLTSIGLLGPDRAHVEVVITHHDPALGRQWGYTINRPGDAVRVGGRWLVSADTYSFLVGSA
jgi:hypothetical protein